ncbi:MAG TPA: GNAT family protein [Terriglobales bacterium]|jgi:RimJ/RimL family protein N-acetyltransferase
MNASNPAFVPTPVILEGKFVRLEPLRKEHGPLLWEAMKDHAEEIFRWIPYPMRMPEDSSRFIENVLGEQQRGLSVPFATIDQESGRMAGSTRFMAIDAANRHVEIGSTWIAPAWQRTAVNTEAKYLMLRHAFEAWKCMRVEFKTDSMNEKSRTAILRLGAKEEGTFRNHMVTWNGRIRHSVYFSIIDSEWPEVKNRLEERITRG